MVAEYLRRPPGKRVNYERIGFPSPFTFIFPFESRSTMKSVQIVAVNRGVPKDFALIFEPSKSDVELLKESPQLIIEPLHKRITKGPLQKTSQEDILNNLSQIKLERKVLGQITSGIYSYETCKGVGIAWITESAIQALPIQTFNEGGRSVAHHLVLFRNKSSRVYHFGMLKQI